MRSIFELISKYKSELMVVPIVAFVALIVTLFFYLFLNKKKIVKYIPGFAALVVAIIFLIQGFVKLLNITGLDFIETSIKIFVFGFTVIFFSAVLDILDSFVKGIKGDGKKRAKKESAKKAVSQ